MKITKHIRDFLKLFLTLAITILIILFFSYTILKNVPQKFHFQLNTQNINTIPDITITYPIECNKNLVSNSKDAKNLCQQIQTYKNDTIFLSHPLTYTNKNKPKLIFYIHGQDELINTHISNNEKFRSKLQDWGKLYANNNYIFIAPNLYGNNWGSQKALDLLSNEIRYYADYFNVSKVYLIGYSMGGLLTYKISAQNPKMFHEVTILAGTLPFDILNYDSCKNLNKTKITIFHGTKDINVPYTASSKLIVDKCHSYKFKYPELHLLKDIDHWQLGYTNNPKILLPENK